MNAALNFADAFLRGKVRIEMVKFKFTISNSDLDFDFLEWKKKEYRRLNLQLDHKNVVL